MTIGEKITAARKTAKLTQQALADCIGVTPQAISIWERDESVPETKNLPALSQALGISIDTLLSEKDPPSWELKSPSFSPERMYTYVKAKAQAEGLTQTLAALPFMREKHHGQPRKGIAGVPFVVHPLMMACHAMAMDLMDDDVIAAALLHDVVEDAGIAPGELPVGDSVREAVRLVSKNVNGGNAYYETIGKNPLAALVKCMDRCNNLSSMADGFTKDRMREYVVETEEHILPLLDVIREVPEYNNAAWLLRYQMITLLETFKRLL